YYMRIIPCSTDIHLSLSVHLLFHYGTPLWLHSCVYFSLVLFLSLLLTWKPYHLLIHYYCLKCHESFLAIFLHYLTCHPDVVFYALYLLLYFIYITSMCKKDKYMQKTSASTLMQRFHIKN